MNLVTLLIIILVLVLVGVLPGWGHSAKNFLRPLRCGVKRIGNMRERPMQRTLRNSGRDLGHGLPAIQTR